VVVAADVHLSYFAQHAGADDIIFGFDEVRGAFSLRADLQYAIVFARGGHHRFAFEDVAADGFLHVDIGAAFDCRDHLQGMPVITIIKPAARDNRKKSDEKKDNVRTKLIVFS
jgi:hypothetical protein